jgi:glucose-6-phosphate 1-epimerase
MESITVASMGGMGWRLGEGEGGKMLPAMSSDLHTLLRTTLPPSVRAEYGPGNLPRLAIKTRLGEARVYFQGAHVTAWHPASASAPVLWMSGSSFFEAGKPLRGGVPICFPWFGPHASDPKAPGHGFARLRDWTLIAATEAADGSVTVALELASDPASELAQSPLWPHAFRAVHRITVGATLTMALEVTNPGPDAFTFEEALHTYFAVRDVREVTITGLERTDYLDKVTGLDRKTQGDDPIRFTGETDRVYLNTTATCVIGDPGARRKIAIRKTGSDATVVWNPWIAKARAMPDFGDDEWPAMVCVETCNVNDHARKLAPGESHTMTAIIEVEGL